ncbi:MAG: hypothetical protein WAK90_13895 [Pseudolabrys sp.]|jgi:hypothetical protein|nr:hypothetical protein [Xanthobacteraceae bacterium]
MLRVLALLTTLILAWTVQVGAATAASIAVLMPGSSGIVPGDFLVRNEARIKGAGIRTILTTSSATAAETVAAEAAQGHKVVIVGMSRGTVDAAAALAAGARPAGVVFVSGIYPRVMATLGTPDKLPATLVIHHSRDACKFTLPIGATEFVTWARGKARLQWINTDGDPGPNPCNAHGAHGFFRQDGPAVSAAIAFIRSR